MNEKEDIKREEIRKGVKTLSECSDLLKRENKTPPYIVKIIDDTCDKILDILNLSDKE